MNVVVYYKKITLKKMIRLNKLNYKNGAITNII